MTAASRAGLDLLTRIQSGNIDSGYGGDDCDEVDLLSHADAATLTAVATDREARRYGFLPDFQFITWDARKAVMTATLSCRRPGSLG